MRGTAGYVTVTLDTTLYAGRPLSLGSGTYRPGDAVSRDDLATMTPRRFQMLLNQRHLRTTKDHPRRLPDAVFEPTPSEAPPARKLSRRERKEAARKG